MKHAKKHYKRKHRHRVAEEAYEYSDSQDRYATGERSEELKISLSIRYSKDGSKYRVLGHASSISAEQPTTSIKIKLQKPRVGLTVEQLEHEELSKKKGRKHKKKKRPHKSPVKESQPEALPAEVGYDADLEMSMDVSLPLKALKRNTQQVSERRTVGGKHVTAPHPAGDTPISPVEKKRKKALKDESQDSEVSDLDIEDSVPSIFLEVDMVEAYKSFLHNIHGMIQRRDLGGIFSEPVTEEIAPGYSNLISQPMDLATMSKKIDDNLYPSVKDFRDDLVLMCKNAMTYNTTDTIYYQAAHQFLAVSLRIMITELEGRPDILQRFGGIPEMETSSEFPIKPTNVKINTKKPFVCQYSLKMLKKIYAQRDGQIHERLKVKVPPELCQEVAEVVMETDSSSMHVGDCSEKCQWMYLPSDEEYKMEVEHMIGSLMEGLEEGDQENMATYCFLNKSEGGRVTTNIINPDGVECKSIDLSVLNTKIQEGNHATYLLETEDSKLKSRPIPYMMYGPYGSFSPVYDSTFATLSRMDSDLLYSTYGDDTGVSYAHSLSQFVEGTGSFVMEMANSMLNTLTCKRHHSLMQKLKKDKGQPEGEVPSSDKPVTREEAPASSTVIIPKLETIQTATPVIIPATEVAPISTEVAPISTGTAPISTVAAPISTGTAPISTVVPPISTGTAPISTEVAPISTGTAPISTEVAPISTEVAPISTVAAPISTGTAPISTVAAPISTVVPPISTVAAPISTVAAPISTGTAPISTGTAPISTGTAPISTVAAPSSIEGGVQQGLSQSIMLQQTLAETAKMILKLQEIQQVRLSKVEQDGTICSPKQEEKALAQSILERLKHLSSLVRPNDLVSQETLRKAMGIVLYSLPPEDISRDETM